MRAVAWSGCRLRLSRRSQLSFDLTPVTCSGDVIASPTRARGGRGYSGSGCSGASPSVTSPRAFYFSSPLADWRRAAILRGRLSECCPCATSQYANECQFCFQQVFSEMKLIRCETANVDKIPRCYANSKPDCCGKYE